MLPKRSPRHQSNRSGSKCIRTQRKANSLNDDRLRSQLWIPCPGLPQLLPLGDQLAVGSWLVPFCCSFSNVILWFPRHRITAAIVCRRLGTTRPSRCNPFPRVLRVGEERLLPIPTTSFVHAQRGNSRLRDGGQRLLRWMVRTR